MTSLTQNLDANRSGTAVGIYSVCSAHPLVIEAAIEQGISDNSIVLIEATANQVNQFGGYTGMKAEDFKQFVYAIADKLSFPIEKLFLGGDHLGPVCWQSDLAAVAMVKSHTLITEYVAAGFKKIHLDCSMACAGDPVPLPDDVIAERGAELCATAEKTAIATFGISDIIYVVGTEVPVPGGTNEEDPEIEVTKAADALATLQTHEAAFAAAGVGNAWPRVRGLVVQPGVEFSHTSVVQYDRVKATELVSVIAQVPHIVFEAHSTDYQAYANYSALVQDHFAILKVGPQLTFALREGLFALSYIEDILVDADDRSNLRSVCDQVMLARPADWQKYYAGDADQQALLRQFSLSDRIRYYWPDAAVKAASEKLLSNLGAIDIPLPLISQFLPNQYLGIINGIVYNDPKSLVKDHIKEITEAYATACWKQ